MIAVPIGPRSQRIITAAAPAYLDAHGRPTHPRDLLDHACLRLRFSSGARATWEFERGDEVIRLDPPGPVLIQPGSACDLWSRRRSRASESYGCSRTGLLRSCSQEPWKDSRRMGRAVLGADALLLRPPPASPSAQGLHRLHPDGASHAKAAEITTSACIKVPSGATE